MSHAFEPAPNPEHGMWKLHYNAIEELHGLKKKQNELDEEQKSSSDNTAEVSGQREEQCCNLWQHFCICLNCVFFVC